MNLKNNNNQLKFCDLLLEEENYTFALTKAFYENGSRIPESG